MDSPTGTKNTTETVLTASPKKQAGAISRVNQIAREILAIVFWLYALMKVFVFDIDLFVFDKVLPEYAAFLKFKFLILIGVVAVAWLITKNKDLLIWFFYITFYPLILLFWKIPRAIFRQRSWSFAFAVTNAVISFFKSIKYNFIAGTSFLIAATIIIATSNANVLWASIAVIFVIVAMTYVNRFRAVFKPSSVFGLYRKFFSGMRKVGKQQFSLDDDMRVLSKEQFSEKQLEKYATNLQTSVLFNRFCLFTARKLQDYQKSRLNIVSDIILLLILFVFTVISFALMNYGIHKIDAATFNTLMKPDFFSFLYYSFYHLSFSSIPQIVPATSISQGLSMVESLFSLLLVSILGSLFLSVKNQKYIDELSVAIGDIEAEGESMETFIKHEYKMNSVEDALTELEKLKSGMLKLIYFLSQKME
jgi:hypothetical protein